MKPRLFLLVLTSITCFCSCIKEQVCTGYNPSANITSFSLFQTAPEKTKLFNSWGDTITLLKREARSTTDFLETCGGIYSGPCNCFAERIVSYYAENPSISINESINRFTDDARVFYSHSLTVGHGHYQLLNQTDYQAKKLKESLQDSAYILQGDSFTNILEIKLDTLFYGYHAAIPVIHKVWVKPDSGLFKLWMNDTCYTVIQ